jgi:hypothetical protein
MVHRLSELIAMLSTRSRPDRDQRDSHGQEFNFVEHAQKQSAYGAQGFVVGP